MTNSAATIAGVAEAQAEQGLGVVYHLSKRYPIHGVDTDLNEK
jgi:hypothetical protein